MEWIIKLVDKARELEHKELIHLLWFHELNHYLHLLLQQYHSIVRMTVRDIHGFALVISEYECLLSRRETIFINFSKDQYFYPTKLEIVHIFFALDVGGGRRMVHIIDDQPGTSRFVTQTVATVSPPNFSVYCRMSLETINPVAHKESRRGFMDFFDCIFPMLRHVCPISNLNVPFPRIYQLEQAYEDVKAFIAQTGKGSEMSDEECARVMNEVEHTLLTIHSAGLKLFSDFVSYVKNRWVLAKTDPSFDF
jgi:hypothetical protein